MNDECVERGRRLLNERGPAGWAWLITEPVDVMNPRRCPLGQIWKGSDHPYSSGLRALGLMAAAGDSIAHGFCSAADEDDAPLNALWEAVIIEERKP